MAENSYGQYGGLSLVFDLHLLLEIVEHKEVSNE